MYNVIIGLDFYEWYTIIDLFYWINKLFFNTGDAFKDFILKFWPIAVIMILIFVIDHFDGDQQALLIVLGFLMLVGFAGLYDKLTNMQNAPSVWVDVQLQVQVMDAVGEYEYLNKMIRFSILPRIGDQISDFGAYVGKVAGVKLYGVSDEQSGDPEASLWCERVVGNAEEMEEIVSDYTEDGWQKGYH